MSGLQASFEAGAPPGGRLLNRNESGRGIQVSGAGEESEGEEGKIREEERQGEEKTRWKRRGERRGRRGEDGRGREGRRVEGLCLHFFLFFFFLPSFPFPTLLSPHSLLLSFSPFLPPFHSSRMPEKKNTTTRKRKSQRMEGEGAPAGTRAGPPRWVRLWWRFQASSGALTKPT